MDAMPVSDSLHTRPGHFHILPRFDPHSTRAPTKSRKKISYTRVRTTEMSRLQRLTGCIFPLFYQGRAAMHGKPRRVYQLAMMCISRPFAGMDGLQAGQLCFIHVH